MKEREAIEELKYDLNELGKAIPCDTGWGISSNEAYGMAIKALEKQIPKKIVDKQKSEISEDIEVYGEYAIFGECPVCKSLQNIMWNIAYCGNCGQKLDWE